MTKLTMMTPIAIVTPSCTSRLMPVSPSEAKVPARMTPAETTVGPACSTASSAAVRGSLPSCTSSRRRVVMRML